ncbi:MAG: phospho-N-acetylmuramoyl-pentapeptide-transferase, partial [Myxococcota bacterium]|nr:phospho-N-acetylmuramoyl-pentapeptide-transferase [Myxococcota bacterium]
MLFELFFMLKDTFSPFNLFRYVSFRVIASMVTSLMVCLLLYPWFIRKLQERQIGQVIRAEGPESHYSKAGTPTMGGVLIVLSVVVSTLLWADLSNPYVGTLLIITVGFGVVGFIDYSMKLRGKSSAGLSGKIRLLIEFGLSGIMMYFLLTHDAFQYDTQLYLPFVSTEKFSMHLPIYVYIPFMCIAIVGTGNAVNLTDGLDGLAIGPVIVAAGTFLALAYG